jgi:carboxymethylenebutenolidase
MSKNLRIKARDNGSFEAYIAYPETGRPAPGVVVIQEIFGVNAGMRAICDDLAGKGFVAICPDLFWRQEPGIQLTDKSEAEWARAFELFKGFNVDLGVEDLKSTLAHLREDKDCTGKAATMGYCLGGKLAYLMATRSDADCNVSYYGVGIQDMLEEAKNIRHPLLMHIAEKDKYVPLEAQQAIQEALDSHKHVEIHVYPGVDHAFARPDGQHFDREAAGLANSRTLDFLASRLAEHKKTNVGT